MIAFYAQIKLAHVALVLLSGLVFTFRGALVLAGKRWAMAAPVRYFSYGVDTLLLTAGILLLVMLRMNPVTTTWMAVKLSLLVLYILVGTFALKRGRSQRTRAICYVVALGIFVLIYSVARSHSPLGLLVYLS